MKKFIVLVTVILLGASAFSLAGKIYKWTDDKGNIHYGERPPMDNAQQLKIPKAPPHSATTPTTKPGDQMEATQKLLDAFAKERKEKAEATARAEKEQKITKENCSRARKRVASLKMGGRKYEVTEQGERNYLDDADIQNRLQKAQKMVGEWCK
jgi:FKBP-type peptidyl-prolyl cis-trans isomerase